jgi:hypothetical protein
MIGSRKVGDPRARGAAEVRGLAIAAAMRPGRIEGVVAEHRHQEITGQRERNQHARLAQALIDLPGKHQLSFVVVRT